jgi:hypothetical protein
MMLLLRAGVSTWNAITRALSTARMQVGVSDPACCFGRQKDLGSWKESALPRDFQAVREVSYPKA